MKRIFKILFLTFYSLGVFCLPMSNFSILPDLPEMFDYCKNNEDKDMTVFDFVTDHLLNIDSVFDKHINGDEQKPHIPKHLIHLLHLPLYSNIKPYSFNIEIVNFFKTNGNFIETDNFTFFDYKSKIFHPPIIA